MGRVDTEFDPPEAGVLNPEYRVETDGWWDASVCGAHPDLSELQTSHRNVTYYVNECIRGLQELLEELRANRFRAAEQILLYDRARVLFEDLRITLEYSYHLWDAAPNPSIAPQEGERQLRRIRVKLDWFAEYEQVMQPPERERLDVDIAYILHAFPRRVIIALRDNHPDLYQTYQTRMSEYVDLEGGTEAEHVHLPFTPRAAYAARFGYLEGVAVPEGLTSKDHIRRIARELRKTIRPGTHFQSYNAMIWMRHAREIPFLDVTVTRLDLAREGLLGEALAVARAASYNIKTEPFPNQPRDDERHCDRLIGIFHSLYKLTVELPMAPILSRHESATFTFHDQHDEQYGPRPRFWEALEKYENLRDHELYGLGPTMKPRDPDQHRYGHTLHRPPPNYVYVPGVEHNWKDRSVEVERENHYRFQCMLEHEALVHYLRDHVTDPSSGEEILSGFSKYVAQQHLDGNYPLKRMVTLRPPPRGSTAICRTWVPKL